MVIFHFTSNAPPLTRLTSSRSARRAGSAEKVAVAITVPGAGAAAAAGGVDVDGAGAAVPAGAVELSPVVVATVSVVALVAVAVSDALLHPKTARSGTRNNAAVAERDIRHLRVGESNVST